MSETWCVVFVWSLCEACMLSSLSFSTYVAQLRTATDSLQCIMSKGLGYCHQLDPNPNVIRKELGCVGVCVSALFRMTQSRSAEIRHLYRLLIILAIRLQYSLK